MKNIHVLPTDKPSRLIKSQDNDFVYLNTNAPNWFENNLKTTKQNIYITSDEEIKDGDYVICDNKLYKIIVTGVLYNGDFTLQTNIEGVFLNPKDCSKIIITDNKDLIEDGVQEISEDFLQWFVKNPSCEEVEVEFDYNYYKFGKSKSKCNKIIIPKEEPKLELAKARRMQGSLTVNKLLEEGISFKKQHTLEEVAEIICYTHKTPIEQANEIIKLVQDKKMYSEEEVLEIFKQAQLCAVKADGVYFKYETFEQFKKK
jgi:hypothetical protein